MALTAPFMEPSKNNEQLSFDGVVFITTTYAGRLPLLIATLSNVMNSIRGGGFEVRFYADAGSENSFSYAQEMLTRIAESTGNWVSFSQIDPTVSVAQSKRIAMMENTKWFINLDDDLIIPRRALERLRNWMYTGGVDFITLGVMDSDNQRGFKDYEPKRWKSLEDFLEHQPLGKAKHHAFYDEGVCTGYKWISQLYALTREVYDDAKIWDLVYEQFTERGVRGYDIVLENQLAASDYYGVLIYGNEAIHIGLEYGYLEGPWKSANDIAKTVVQTKEFNNAKDET